MTQNSKSPKLKELDSPPDIEPWRNDSLMADNFPNWKSIYNKKIKYDPNEPAFVSPYSSPVKIAFAHAREILDDWREYEYVGDKRCDKGNVTHWFRHLVDRKLTKVVAPKTYTFPKKNWNIK